MVNHVLKKVYEAGARAGFNLEYRTLQVFQELWPDSYGVVNYAIERFEIAIDVCAQIRCEKRNKWLHYLVECKGTDPDNFLLLVQSQLNISNGRYKKPDFDTIAFKKDSLGQLCLNTNEERCITADPNDGPISVFTGNFFNGNNYKRTTPADDKNNLFKAVLQLQKACKLYPPSVTFASAMSGQVHPVIVTNATIYVQDYQNQKICNPPWVIYLVAPNIDGVRMPYAYVVNIDYLNQFLKTWYGQYPNGIKPEWKSIT